MIIGIRPKIRASATMIMMTRKMVSKAARRDENGARGLDLFRQRALIEIYVHSCLLTRRAGL